MGTHNNPVEVGEQNPRDNFCRRYGHQTTVIDDKLYIDGGYVNFDTFPTDNKTYPNTWLGFHDLNNFTSRGGELWPNLNISLNKDPEHIPTVHGGVLWGDSVNKRFFLVGGEETRGYASSAFHFHSYDILYDRWDDFGEPETVNPPNISSYGAGVGVSETGHGYYYGGWISNASMRGWTGPRTMSSNFYCYEYDTNTTTAVNPPDSRPRAEGAMAWIPAGDSVGMLVYFGGLVSPHGNETTEPQPLDEIFLYDPSTNSWETQRATGEIPSNRRQFCADAAWAPDRSSYNIYMWGGLSVEPPDVNVTAPNNMYILTLPSFIWLKVFPDRRGNASFEFGHYAASCNMVKGNSQMFIIGGTYPNSGDETMCDLAQAAWAQHNLFTGTKGNVGNDPNGTYWALPDPSITSNVVPIDVYRAVGGNKDGGATLLSPRSGFDTPDGTIQSLITKKPTFAARSATRVVPTGTPVPIPSSDSSPLSTGAIVGIAVGSAAAIGLLIIAWVVIGRHVLRKREEQRRQSLVSEPYNFGPGFVSPESAQTPFGIAEAPATGRHRAGDDLTVSSPASEPQPERSSQQGSTNRTGPPAELEAQRTASQRGSVHL
ncbi:hypothetical protein C7999DRAFT_18358 [Corynascus novoguineensis]|uniref:Kelch repeat-containing protein n=1 Tax=Corynascus novoguineensis TaxID=1126955 RepID=A0AAN7HIC6_9PEZI|nr:hypothetical protein C7999DRAFT_18358 [Corynascus novoguineensis]